MIKSFNIVLEGMDGVGKTTFAKELQKTLGWKIVQGSSFEHAEKGADYLFDYQMGLVNTPNIIIDRLHISNYIYGPIYDKNTMSIDQFLALKETMSRNNTELFLLTAPMDVIIERLTNRGDKDIDVNDVHNLQRIHDSYQMFANHTLAVSWLLPNRVHEIITNK